MGTQESWKAWHSVMSCSHCCISLFSPFQLKRVSGLATWVSRAMSVWGILKVEAGRKPMVHWSMLWPW